MLKGADIKEYQLDRFLLAIQHQADIPAEATSFSLGGVMHDSDSATEKSQMRHIGEQAIAAGGNNSATIINFNYYEDKQGLVSLDKIR